jgi:hypothetical protein
MTARFIAIVGIVTLSLFVAACDNGAGSVFATKKVAAASAPAACTPVPATCEPAKAPTTKPAAKAPVAKAPAEKAPVAKASVTKTPTEVVAKATSSGNTVNVFVGGATPPVTAAPVVVSQQPKVSVAPAVAIAPASSPVVNNNCPAGGCVATVVREEKAKVCGIAVQKSLQDKTVVARLQLDVDQAHPGKIQIAKVTSFEGVAEQVSVSPFATSAQRDCNVDQATVYQNWPAVIAKFSLPFDCIPKKM